MQTRLSQTALAWFVILYEPILIVMKKLLLIVGPTFLVLAGLVNRFGLQWGLSSENKETTEGLLTGMGIGFLAWLGFTLWKGEKPTS